MKKGFIFRFNKVLLCALLFLIAVNVMVAYSEDAILLQITRSIFIPVFLIFFSIRNKYLSLPFALFFMFSFLGDASLTFFEDDTFAKTSGILYFLSYMSLISVVISKVKFFEMDKIVAIYLLFVFLINAYFIYALYGILKVVVSDNFELILFGVKNMFLIFLAFLAFGRYLNKETKPSILFLMVVLCLMFSAILNYVNTYYIYNWSFVLIERVIYVTGLYLLFNYIIEENKKITTTETYISEGLLA